MKRKLALIFSVVSFLLFLGSFLIHPAKVEGFPNINSSNVKGSSLLFLNKNIDLALSKDPLIDSWYKETSILGVVSINTINKVPKVGFKLDGITEVSLYTKDGVFAGTTTDPVVPLIYVHTQFDDRKSTFIAKLSSALISLLQVTDLSLQNESLVVKTAENITAIYPFEGDIDTLLGKTVLVFSQLNGSPEKFMIKDSHGVMKKPSFVDLRFKSPILREEKEM